MRTMKMLICAGLCLAVQAGGPAAVLADGGDEMLMAHPMPLYPGSVLAGEERNYFLTKDDLGAVRKFFEARLKPGDKIGTFSGDGETGFTVTYTKKSGQRELKAHELRVSARTEKDPPHQAFGELNRHVQFGRRKEAEFKALEKEYSGLEDAYFREAREGRARNEAEAILARANGEAHPDAEKLKAAGRKSKVSAEEKASAQDFKKQMQELKKKGDIAGMMKLAQSRKEFQSAPGGQLEAVKMAEEDQNRDTWDLWVKCLRDTKAAAYRTRLEYAENALPK